MAAVKHTVRTGKVFDTTRKRVFKSPIDKAKGYEVVWQQVSGLFEAARNVENATFVYLIGEIDDGPIKIGSSKDPIGRLRTMQTGNPRRLRIEYVLLAETHTEKLLHEIWERHGIVSARSKRNPDLGPGTEWFQPEIRAELLPIIADAVARQIEYLRSVPGDGSYLDLERAVRDAHYAAGLVLKRREETRFLAEGSGYVVRRRSLI